MALGIPVEGAVAVAHEHGHQRTHARAHGHRGGEPAGGRVQQLRGHHHAREPHDAQQRGPGGEQHRVEAEEGEDHPGEVTAQQRQTDPQHGHGGEPHRRPPQQASVRPPARDSALQGGPHHVHDSEQRGQHGDEHRRELPAGALRPGQQGAHARERKQGREAHVQRDAHGPQQRGGAQLLGHDGPSWTTGGGRRRGAVPPESVVMVRTSPRVGINRSVDPGIIRLRTGVHPRWRFPGAPRARDWRNVGIRTFVTGVTPCSCP